MNTIALIRSTVQRERRISITAGPAAAATARRQVRAAVRTWNIPVDLPTAELLTSELVTNAIRYEVSGAVRLVITSANGALRVDVHDTSPALPMPVNSSPDAETGRGLVLVASLSTDWGWYLTPTGKAVYFMVAHQDGFGEGDRP